MQWNGGVPPPSGGRHNPLRTVLESVQERAAPYIDKYGNGYGDLLNSIFRGGTEMVPGAGDLVALEDLQNATREGDAVGMGLGLLGAIPGIPAIGKGVRRGRRVRGEVDAVSDVSRQVDGPEYRVQSSQDLSPTDTPESLRAQGYEIDPQTNTWARTVAEEPTPESYPIRAYHGSPHSFEQFSLDKIGTGEGAQAYGHGLYFAESEDVARSYRDDLSQRVGAEFRFADGTTFSPTPDQAIALEGSLKDGNTYGWTNWTLNELSDPKVAEIDRLLRERGPPVERVSNSHGSMYEVGINAHPDTFLDWDAPYSQQPSGAQWELSGGDYSPVPLTGGDLYRKASADGGAEALNQRLLTQGINGIRYLDGNSRGGGEGSSNYVVFNDELVKVLRKYGISGLGLGLGAGAVAGQDDGGI